MNNNKKLTLYVAYTRQWIQNSMKNDRNCKVISRILYSRQFHICPNRTIQITLRLDEVVFMIFALDSLSVAVVCCVPTKTLYYTLSLLLNQFTWFCYDVGGARVSERAIGRPFNLRIESICNHKTMVIRHEFQSNDYINTLFKSQFAIDLSSINIWQSCMRHADWHINTIWSESRLLAALITICAIKKNVNKAPNDGRKRVSVSASKCVDTLKLLRLHSEFKWSKLKHTRTLIRTVSRSPEL